MTPKQERLYDLLSDAARFKRQKSQQIEPDVSISTCYSTVYAGTYLASNRDMQQKIAPLISRINKHIAPHKIIPGERKRTYRLELDYIKE